MLTRTDQREKLAKFRTLDLILVKKGLNQPFWTKNRSFFTFDTKTTPYLGQNHTFFPLRGITPINVSTTESHRSINK